MYQLFFLTELLIAFLRLKKNTQNPINQQVILRMKHMPPLTATLMMMTPALVINYSI